jgi:hypothetical protein
MGEADLWLACEYQSRSKPLLAWREDASHVDLLENTSLVLGARSDSDTHSMMWRGKREGEVSVSLSLGFEAWGVYI